MVAMGWGAEPLGGRSFGSSGGDLLAGPAVVDDGVGDLAAAAVAGDGAEEPVALEDEEAGGLGRLDGGSAGDVAEEGDLAEGFAGALVAAEEAVFEDLDLAALDQVEAVADLALDDQLLAGRRLDWDEVVAEALDRGDRQGREDRALAQQPVA